MPDSTQVNDIATARLAMATSAVGISQWEMLPDFTVLWDAQTYRLYGHEPDTAMTPGAIFRQAQTAANYKVTTAWLRQAITQDASSIGEFEICWPNGEVRYLAARACVQRDVARHVRSLLGVTWDITEQRRAKLAARQHRRDLVALTRRLKNQEQNTCRKLAQALHDQLGQTLAAIRLNFDALQADLPADQSSSVYPRRLDQLITLAISQVRCSLVELRPPLLEELGLIAALEHELGGPGTTHPGTELIFEASAQAQAQRWPAPVEFACFMIAREAVTNALQHAQANLVLVCLEAAHSGLAISIVDDGIGYDSVQQQDVSRQAGHLGLVGMHERAQAINAVLTIQTAPAQGTQVNLQWTPAV